jgi:hypothetical protein
MSEFISQDDRPNELLVRAHHIKFFMMYERGAAPDKIAASTANAANIGWYNTEDLSVLDSPEPVSEIDGQEFNSAYRVDVLGKNNKNRGRFTAGAKNLIDRYVALGSNTDVTLGVGVLDSMCNGCAYQRHCRNIHPERTPTDRATIKIFSQVAQELGFDDQVTATDTLLCTNGQTTQAVVKKLATSVDSLDSAIANMDLTGNPLVSFSFGRRKAGLA